MKKRILYSILNEWRDEDMDDSPIDLDDDMNIEPISSDMDNEPDLDDDDFALSTQKYNNILYDVHNFYEYIFKLLKDFENKGLLASVYNLYKLCVRTIGVNTKVHLDNHYMNNTISNIISYVDNILNNNKLLISGEEFCKHNPYKHINNVSDFKKYVHGNCLIYVSRYNNIGNDGVFEITVGGVFINDKHIHLINMPIKMYTPAFSTFIVFDDNSVSYKRTEMYYKCCEYNDFDDAKSFLINNIDNYLFYNEGLCTFNIYSCNYNQSIVNKLVDVVKYLEKKRDECIENRKKQ